MKKRLSVLLVLLMVVALLVPMVGAPMALAAKPIVGPLPQLPGNKIPQFIDPLPDLHILDGTTGSQIVLNMEEFLSPVMPSTWAPKGGVYNGTKVFGYKQTGQTATSYIGPVILSEIGTPTEIKFVNNLPNANVALTTTFGQAKSQSYGDWTDQSLHWANPDGVPMMIPNPNPPPDMVGQTQHYNNSIPAVPHLHGGEVPPTLDGGPEAWFTSVVDGSIHGPAFYSGDGNSNKNWAIYRYPNTQEEAPLWFHDHLLGATRLNVYAGMAGAYLLKDPANERWDPNNTAGIEALPPLVPLIIQDRMFDTQGQWYFPNVGLNLEHPYWQPEFVGDTIVVNGKVWPYKTVDQQRYLFWFLNGSNARPYDMFLQDPLTGVKGPPMWVIGTDGGFLDAPVLIDPNQTKKAGQQSLVMMPGERYLVTIDFADPAWQGLMLAAGVDLSIQGVNLILRNTARTPFPDGAPAQSSTTGRIMQFQVSTNKPTDNSFDPAAPATPAGWDTPLRKNKIIRLVDPVAGNLATNPDPVTADVTRQLTLNEVMGMGGPLEVLVNNTKWSGLLPDHVTPVPDSVPDGIGNYLTELPNEGDTEVWEIINMTADAHPIHLHLVQFQLMNRQAYDAKAYIPIYDGAFTGGLYIPAGGPPLNYFTGNPRALGGNPDPTLIGLPIPPLPSEAGWKDTVIMYPGEVTRIAVRWAPTNKPIVTPAGMTLTYPFDPGGGDYVWHCHIIDHEDNEMMRPDQVVPQSVERTYVQGVDY